MPSGSSLRAQGDDLMREHWASLQSTWLEEHYFSDSSSSAGIHKPGSARIYTGTASQVSAPGATDDEGRLMYVPATNQIHVLGESATTAVTRRPFVGAGVFVSVGSIGFTSATASPVTFNAERFNVGSVATGGPSGSTWLKVPTGEAGVYQVNGTLSISADSTLGAGNEAYLEMRVENVLRVFDQQSTGTVRTWVVSSMETLSAGSHVVFRFYQDSGSRWSVGAADFSIGKLD